MRLWASTGFAFGTAVALSLLLGETASALAQNAKPADQSLASQPTVPGPQPNAPVKAADLKPAPATPIAVEKKELGDPKPWDPDWDKTIEAGLPADLLSPALEHEVKPICPRFRTLTVADRRAFWAYFFQALAGAEAGLKPTMNVRHTQPEVAVIDPVTGHTIRQEGLLQLAYADADRYGCDFDWTHDKVLPEHDPAKTILQPKNNLLCGVKILENQLVTRHEDLFNKQSYWVTLRPRHPSFIVFIRQMANVPSYCGSRYHSAVRSTRSLPPASEAKNQTANGTTPAPAEPAQPSGATKASSQSTIASH
jgi:hypothetical protein